MERTNMHSSDPHHSSADLLSWSHIHHSSAANPSNQPSDDIGDVLGGGGKTTNKEAESLNKKFDSFRMGLLVLQGGHISFSGKENAGATPKKLTTSSAEASKLKVLGRSVVTQADSKSKKRQISNSTGKAITGRDIFASPPPPETQVAATKQQVNMKESAKASNGKSGDSEEHVAKSSSRKTHNNQLTSNDIFRSDRIPPGYLEKMHSSAKSREMRGNNIFADGKSKYRDYYGGARRPPGGESTISLV